MRARPNISVIGSAGHLSPATRALAERVGEIIGACGFSLVCGGRDGVMDAAASGFSRTRTHGVAVGLLPEDDTARASPWMDVALPTGLGLARNALVARAGAAVVVVSGGAGTLSELALAWQFDRPIAAIVASGGFAAEFAGRRLDARRSDCVVAIDPVESLGPWLRAVTADAEDTATLGVGR